MMMEVNDVVNSILWVPKTKGFKDFCQKKVMISRITLDEVRGMGSFVDLSVNGEPYRIELLERGRQAGQDIVEAASNALLSRRERERGGTYPVDDPFVLQIYRQSGNRRELAADVEFYNAADGGFRKIIVPAPGDTLGITQRSFDALREAVSGLRPEEYGWLAGYARNAVELLRGRAEKVVLVRR